MQSMTLSLVHGLECPLTAPTGCAPWAHLTCLPVMKHVGLDFTPPKNWMLMTVAVVNLGSRRFCVARFFDILDDLGEYRSHVVVFTGVEVVPEKLGLGMLKNKPERDRDGPEKPGWAGSGPSKQALLPRCYRFIHGDAAAAAAAAISAFPVFSFPEGAAARTHAPLQKQHGSTPTSALPPSTPPPPAACPQGGWNQLRMSCQKLSRQSLHMVLRRRPDLYSLSRMDVSTLFYPSNAEAIAAEAKAKEEYQEKNGRSNIMLPTMERLPDPSINYQPFRSDVSYPDVFSLFGESSDNILCSDAAGFTAIYNAGVPLLPEHARDELTQGTQTRGRAVHPPHCCPRQV
ncbi:uncharacterized protein [Setaria viridis]|uniref:uncharacterized protein isoform X2 n=1 Tax=Setaria viridis TaxID=4556 RepID=UPI0014936E79|nr:uncharacterized protein LOC117846866 isoform X2 [Setaria viridis]